MNIQSFQKQEAEIAKELGVAANRVCVVGSTLICGGGNDVDFLCLVPCESVVHDCGFSPDVEVQYESELHSYRRDGQNIIATTNLGFFLAEVAIAHAARLINEESFDMSKRDDRIRFHGLVREQVMARMYEEAEF